MEKVRTYPHRYLEYVLRYIPAAPGPSKVPLENGLILSATWALRNILGENALFTVLAVEPTTTCILPQSQSPLTIEKSTFVSCESEAQFLKSIPSQFTGLRLRTIMSTTVANAGAKPEVSKTAKQTLGMRKNGKQWHAPKKAFRPGSGLTSYAKRAKDREAQAAMKAKEKEIKEEQEEERKAKVTRIKERRAAKEEKDRYAKLAEKMHKKRVERLKRKEKRNKLINS